MKKVHDNVHKRYSDKTMLTIKTKLLKILHGNGLAGQRGVHIGKGMDLPARPIRCWHTTDTGGSGTDMQALLSCE